MLPIAVVAAVLAVAMMGFLMPVAAAPAAPYFGPNVKVTALPAYYASQPSLAVGTDGVVYLAFAGYAGTTTAWDIFFAKSADGGRTWTIPMRVNNDPGNAGQGEPDLTLGPNNDIYIAWTDGRGGNNDVYFSRSTDGGLSFSNNVRANDVTTFAQDTADVAVDSQGLIHVVWTDDRNLFSTGPDIYYANSTDGGVSFNPSLRINNDATGAEQDHPTIAVAPDRSVYVAWDDPRNGARGRDIYFSKSTNFGGTWTANSIVSDDTSNAAQTDPAIAIDAAGTMYVVWDDSRTANTSPDIYASRSTNAGATFAANVKVNDEAGAVYQGPPALAVQTGHVQAMWADARTSGSTSWDIYTASSADGIAWGRNVRVNDDALPNFQYLPTVGVDTAGNVFAAFFDQRSSGTDVYAATLDVVPPTAAASPDFAVDQGVPADFDGSGSTDNFGIASYAWDFGDSASAVGATASHAYAQPGVYTATLTVTDYSGNAASDTVVVTVQDTSAPVARGGGDRSGIEGEPVFFDALASSDNVGVTSYAWSFGDGATASMATASHVYARPGTYQATLTVTDAAGNTATSTFTVTVGSNPLAGTILLLETISAALAIALALLGWIVFGMRKREKQPPGAPPGATQPRAPPTPPPKEPDPLDLPLPPPPRSP